MEAVIKLKPEELTSGVLSEIKRIIGKKNNVEITITINDTNEEYLTILDRSINDLKMDRDTVTFAMDEFLEYPIKKSKK